MSIELPLAGSCHCGAVRFHLKVVPDWITICNCTLCRRINARWAHADPKDVTLDYPADGVIRYIQGDKLLATISCATCGSTTHWEPVDPPDHPRMGLNLNMADPAAIAGIPVRYLDAADSWEYTYPDTEESER